jgi:dTDP-4-amino-4,6-dideoxygalactose transaminase
MRLLGVDPGDEVICSSLTFSASANPIMYEWASPVFVDCDATWTMDPNLLEDVLNGGQPRRGWRPPDLISQI